MVRLTDEDLARYHPFGVSFMMMPWSVPSGEKIDKYERFPYLRVVTTVEYLGDEEARKNHLA